MEGQMRFNTDLKDMEDFKTMREGFLNELTRFKDGFPPAGIAAINRLENMYLILLAAFDTDAQFLEDCAVAKREIIKYSMANPEPNTVHIHKTVYLVLCQGVDELFADFNKKKKQLGGTGVQDG